MIQQAIIKINAEMQEHPNNPNLERAGHHVIDAITNNEAAAAVLAEGKTLKKALRLVGDEAKKWAIEGLAMLPDEEGYAIIDKYFGIESTAPAPVPAAPAKAGISLDISDFF